MKTSLSYQLSVDLLNRDHLIDKMRALSTYDISVREYEIYALNLYIRRPKHIANIYEIVEGSYIANCMEPRVRVGLNLRAFYLIILLLSYNF